MSTRARLREAERALRRDPDNLVLRLRLAAALRDAGRLPDAVELYRSVAVAYQREGRLVQALAVCRSTLEVAPDDFPTRVLLQEIEDARTGAQGDEPTRLAGDGPPTPRVAPVDYDFDEDDERTNR